MSRPQSTIFDFSRSAVRWSRPALSHELSAPESQPRGNSARIPIDATCTIRDDRSEAGTRCYLIAPGRKEWMYRASGLIVEPSTEYRVIFSTDRQLDVTMHGHTEDVHRPPDTTSGFTSLDFETVTTVARQLPTYQDIVDAALTTTPLVGRIDMTSESGALSAEILFPIRTINYHTSPMRFQVDTGPLIVPDLDAQIDHPVDRCRLAHVIFNTFDYAEFVCRRDEPTEPAGDSGALFHHYSQVESHSVNTRLFATDS